MKGVGKAAILLRQSREANIGESRSHHKISQRAVTLDLKKANSPHIICPREGISEANIDGNTRIFGRIGELKGK